jgi:6,7-dimethyl-8-ribityllumazine synthase
MSESFEELRRRFDDEAVQPYDHDLHEKASEDVLSGLVEAEEAVAVEEPAAAPKPTVRDSGPEEGVPEEPGGSPVAEATPEPEPEPVAEHAPPGFRVPDGYALLEGTPNGSSRAVGVVVSRFNGEITGRMLERALATLEEEGVAREALTVVPVPGAFELPPTARAWANPRHYACVVALGCVIRGDTPHFDFVAGEAASGLQLAALETGVPVAFGVLTCETLEQAEARVERAADAARGALEMADLFGRMRASAQGQGG